MQSVLDTNKVELKGIAVTIQDLTREVELNAAQNRFISNVSHELRTPLFNIKSYVETLYDLKDQLIRETIINTQEKVEEIDETVKKIDEKLFEIIKD